MAKKKTSANASKKAAKKKSTTKTAKKKTVTKAAKKTAKKTAKKAGRKTATTRRSQPAATSFPPTPEAIAKAAYLNYLDRVSKGLPGDEHADWLAAEAALRAA